MHHDVQPSASLAASKSPHLEFGLQLLSILQLLLLAVVDVNHLSQVSRKSLLFGFLR